MHQNFVFTLIFWGFFCLYLKLISFFVFNPFQTLFCVFCIYLDRLQAWGSDEDHIWRVPIKSNNSLGSWMTIPIVIIITVLIDILLIFTTLLLLLLIIITLLLLIITTLPLLIFTTLLLLIIIVDYFSPILTLRSAVSSAPAAPHRGLPFFPETEITVQNIAISEIEVILF